MAGYNPLRKVIYPMKVYLSKSGKKSEIKIDKIADVWPFDTTRVSICADKQGQIGITIADDRLEKNVVLELQADGESE